MYKQTYSGSPYIGLKFDDEKGLMTVENNMGFNEIQNYMHVKDGMLMWGMAKGGVDDLNYFIIGEDKEIIYLKYSDIKEVKSKVESSCFSKNGKILITVPNSVIFACYDYMQAKKEIYILGEDGYDWFWVYRNYGKGFENGNNIIDKEKTKLMIGNNIRWRMYIDENFGNVIKEIGFEKGYYNGKYKGMRANPELAERAIEICGATGCCILGNIGEADKDGKIIYK